MKHKTFVQIALWNYNGWIQLDPVCGVNNPRGGSITHCRWKIRQQSPGGDFFRKLPDEILRHRIEQGKADPYRSEYGSVKGADISQAGLPSGSCSITKRLKSLLWLFTKPTVPKKEDRIEIDQHRSVVSHSGHPKNFVSEAKKGLE